MAAVRSVADGPEILGVYLFEMQPDERGGWVLHVGVQLTPGAPAPAVMSAIGARLRTDAGLRTHLPRDPPLRLVALSRRRLAVVRRFVPPL